MTAIVHVHQSPSTVVVSVPDEWDYFYPTLREGFAAALRYSIERSGLFAHVLRDGTANFQLLARITHVDVPLAPFGKTISMEVDYILSRNESTQVVWRKTITSSYASDAFVGRRRWRLATEGAARSNIEQAIQEISQLRLE